MTRAVAQLAQKAVAEMVNVVDGFAVDKTVVCCARWCAEYLHEATHPTVKWESHTADQMAKIEHIVGAAEVDRAAEVA